MNRNRKLITCIFVCVAILALLFTAGCKPEPARKTLLGKWVDQHGMTWEFKKGGTLIMSQPGGKDPITNTAHYEVLDELSFRMVLSPDTEIPITKKVRYKLKMETADLTIDNFGDKKGSTFNLTRVVDSENEKPVPTTKPVKKVSKYAGFINQILLNRYPDKYLSSKFMHAVFKEINSLPRAQ